MNESAPLFERQTLRCLAIHRLSKARAVEHVRTRTLHLDAFLSFVEADVHFIQ